MFTGIIEERGEVLALDRGGDLARLAVRGPKVTATAAPGSSIAVNGTCLTVTAISGDTFTADVMGETLERTSLGALKPGAAVNLERPVPADGRIDGHIVQGHVDGTGVISQIRPEPDWHVVRITIPVGLDFYIAKKGSIAVDGISLTVSDLGSPGWFEVSLIPETLRRTTLGLAGVGDQVNIEVDVIAKYVERLLARGA
jgi:riboflavin synthase